MKNFRFSDYIYRIAYRLSNSNSKGKPEVDAVEKALGHSRQTHGDFLNPFSIRALTAGTASAGGSTVADLISGLAPQTFYEHSIFMSYGTVLTGLKSDVTLDAKNTPVVLTENAVGENEANTFSTEPAWSNIKLSPKHIRVSIEISRTLLEQSSRSVDDLILNDMRSALSSELDRQIIRGDSSDEEISEIVNTTDISSATWGVVSALTNASASEKIIAAEKSLGDAKVPTPYQWLLNAETRAKLRTLRTQGLAYPIFSDENKILGYDALITENLNDADLHLINPAFVVVGLWHADAEFDLIVDGYSKSNQGKVVLTMSIMADAALVKPKALHVISES